MGMWDWLPTLIQTGATLLGSSKASKANDQATQVAVQQQNKATQAELQALKLAEENQRLMQTAASPGLMRTQQIINRGEELTPEQLIALDDGRRQTLDALHGGSLRGSARATAATVNDVEGRMRADMIAANRNRSDNAAQGLTGQYFNAGSGITNIMGQQGTAVSQGLINTGQNLVDSTKNAAAIKGTAIGDISAVIADQLKASQMEKRSSSYDPITWDSERKGVA